MWKTPTARIHHEHAMRSLSAKDIVGVWGLCEHQAPIARALAIIQAAFPAMPAGDIARLSVGRRDLLLLMIRRAMLGTTFESVAECPKCTERLEFTLNAADLEIGSLEPAAHEYELAFEQYRVRYRLLDSYDIIDAGACASIEEARALLVDSAVLDATVAERSVRPDQLPADVVERLAVAITENDPQAELLLNLDCPACGHGWQVLFDVATFFWDEVLRDVHFIASKYGWSEDAILSMSPMKRKLYLEM